MTQQFHLGKAALAGLGMAAAIAFAAPAQAAFTPVGSNPHEPTLTQILDSLYGPGSYTRIDDALDNFWPMPGSPRGDVVIDFQVRYAADRGQFGFYRDGGGSYTPLFNFGPGSPSATVTAAGPYSANPDGSFTIPLGDMVTDTVTGTFSWGYLNRESMIFYSSNAAANAGTDAFQADHMVTFELDDGDPTVASFVIGWEDRISMDYDYNDAIIQLTFREQAVPEPGTLSLLGMGLLGFAAVRRRRSS